MKEQANKPKTAKINLRNPATKTMQYSCSEHANTWWLQ
jgi:hypothetical protein